MTEWSPVLSSSTLTRVNERITDMMWASPFVAGLKCSLNVFWGFSSFAWQRGTLQLIAIHLITLHNILEYMQIAIIQTEAADFVKMNVCVILKTFGHDCTIEQSNMNNVTFKCIIALCNYYLKDEYGKHTRCNKKMMQYTISTCLDYTFM